MSTLPCPLPVRATAVGRDAERNTVLAGDPKVFRLLCNSSLNMNIPSRSKEERIRILSVVSVGKENTTGMGFPPLVAYACTETRQGGNPLHVMLKHDEKGFSPSLVAFVPMET